MSKTVKTVIGVAAVAAGAYAMYGMPGGYGSFGSMLRSAGTFISKNALAVGGLAMSSASAISQRKYGKQAANNLQNKTAAENKAIESRNRYNQLLQKRQRTEAIRKARISQADITAGTANSGLGSGGTSGFSGSVSAVASQTSANLGNLSVARDQGNEISALNITAANYGSDANTAQSKSNMWSTMNTLGQNVVSSKLFSSPQEFKIVT